MYFWTKTTTWQSHPFIGQKRLHIMYTKQSRIQRFWSSTIKSQYVTKVHLWGLRTHFKARISSSRSNNILHKHIKPRFNDCSRPSSQESIIKRTQVNKLINLGSNHISRQPYPQDLELLLNIWINLVLLNIWMRLDLWLPDMDAWLVLEMPEIYHIRSMRQLQNQIVSL